MIKTITYHKLCPCKPDCGVRIEQEYKYEVCDLCLQEAPGLTVSTFRICQPCAYHRWQEAPDYVQRVLPKEITGRL